MSTAQHITENEVLALLGQSGIVPVYYHDHLATALQMLQACYDGGLRVFEWVARGANALSHFEPLLAHAARHCPGMAIGAGTILTEQQADAFIEKGAAFLVSPVFSDDVLDRAYYNKVPYIPGCFTPTEIYNAYTAGCEWVKIFPGEAISPGYVKGIKAVLPQVKIMVTGGIQPEKAIIQAWHSNGANAVGLGSQLFALPDTEAIVSTLRGLL
jgi:2-dehydro-3-deoxyphosphogluconate aldolase / (4S)-4-hydroxy-2-oxoglutarate aldolase